MDSYIAITLFGCFFCAGLYWCAHFVLNRYCDCSFNAVDVSLGISRQSLFRNDWLMDWITLPCWQSPFFIFAGTLMNSGGIAIRLINLARVMVGRVPSVRLVM